MMAGSYKHVVNDKGQFVGADLLENPGDVYEAVEEMYGMIWRIADQLARATDADAPEIVEMARLHWEQGFKLSPGRGVLEQEEDKA